MGKHEIRLRRQRITAKGTERFKNYDSILKRHEYDQRVRRIIKIFTFFAIALILILLFITVSRWEEKKLNNSKQATPEQLNQ